ncbi:MAG: SPFH domain-containing protein [Patescibacteria group bacterium]|nr:SPFH domain-containing protein [Patescibacteria group bacterium]
MPNLNPELLEISAFISSPLPLISAAPAAIIAGTSAAKSFTIVHQSEMGVRTRGGAPMLKPEISNRILQEICDELPERRIRCLSQINQLPKDERRERINEKIDELPEEIREEGIYRIVGRGVVWLRPFIDHVPKINVADQTTVISPFELESEEDTQMLVTPSVTWRVRSDFDNPFKALFNINNEKESRLKNKTQELEQTVEWICSEGLGLVLGDWTYQRLKKLSTSDKAEITRKTKELCDKDMLKYGTQIEAVRLKPSARTAAERLAQAIEKNPDSADAGIIGGIATSRRVGRRVMQLVPPSAPPDAAA